MSKIRAAITGVDVFLPEYKLTNDELSTMVDTSDEWIMQRIGIKERRILKDKDKASAYMGIKAVKSLLKKTNTEPADIELLITATITPDMLFPSTSNIIAYKTGLKNAWTFDLLAACSGFLFALQTGTEFIENGKYKKVIIVGSSGVNK
jgi:3-oxoacyl-[acyl-carrier-protein] synthase-3